MNDERYDWMITCAKNMGSVTVSYDELKDLRPVVRCKDCENYKQNTYSGEDDLLCMCWPDWIPTDPDDFCSYGERKEGAE